MNVELIDRDRQRVVSMLELDVSKDIFPTRKEPVVQKLYTMTQKNKAVKNPRIRLSIDAERDTESGLLQNDIAGRYTTEPSADEDKPAPLEALGDTPEEQQLINEIYGNLKRYDGDYKGEVIFLSVVGPPFHKRYYLAEWQDEDSFLHGDVYAHKIDLMKVRSVEKSNMGDHIFEVNYAQESIHDKRQMLLGSLDRPRDAWMQAIASLIKARHAAKREQRGH